MDLKHIKDQGNRELFITGLEGTEVTIGDDAIARVPASLVAAMEALGIEKVSRQTVALFMLVPMSTNESGAPAEEAPTGDTPLRRMLLALAEQLKEAEFMISTNTSDTGKAVHGHLAKVAAEVTSTHARIDALGKALARLERIARGETSPKRPSSSSARRARRNIREDKDKETSAADLLPIPVSVQTMGRNALSSIGVKTVGQVRIMSRRDLMHVKLFGALSFTELHAALTELGVEVHESWGAPEPAESDEPVEEPKQKKQKPPKTRIN